MASASFDPCHWQSSLVMVNLQAAYPKKAGQTDGAENVPLGQFSERSLDLQQTNRTNRMRRTCREISAHEQKMLLSLVCSRVWGLSCVHSERSRHNSIPTRHALPERIHCSQRASSIGGIIKATGCSDGNRSCESCSPLAWINFMFNPPILEGTQAPTFNSTSRMERLVQECTIDRTGQLSCPSADVSF